MIGSKKTGLLWVLTVLFALAVLSTGISGVNSIRRLRYWTPWHVSTGPVAVTALPEEETIAYGANRDYYRLEFELTNNSGREVKAQAYSFDVSLTGAERYDLRLLGDEGTAEYRRQAVVPAGCTSKVSLVLGVDKGVSATQGHLVFDAYDQTIQLGTVQLPAA